MNLVSKLTAGAAVAFAISLAPAFADGYEKKASYAAPAAPVCDAAKFGGAFIGIHGGYGTMESTLTNRDLPFLIGLGQSNVQSSDGYVAGGQIGYNFARCNTIFGIEADFAMSNIDESKDYFFGLANVNHSLDWLSSVRTKAGVAVGDMFIYATGGVAFASIDSSVSIGGTTVYRNDDTRIGWVAGLGTEYAISDRVRLTGDVMYYDFGTETTAIGGVFRVDDHHSLWVSRIGLNFKLGGDHADYAPMK